MMFGVMFQLTFAKSKRVVKVSAHKVSLILVNVVFTCTNVAKNNTHRNHLGGIHIVLPLF